MEIDSFPNFPHMAELTLYPIFPDTVDTRGGADPGHSSTCEELARLRAGRAWALVCAGRQGHVCLGAGSLNI